MDDETEEDAIERIKEELSEKYEGEVSQIEGVQVILFSYLFVRMSFPKW